MKFLKFLFVFLFLFSIAGRAERIKIGVFGFPEWSIKGDYKKDYRKMMDKLEKIFKEYKSYGIERIYYHTNSDTFKARRCKTGLSFADFHKAANKEGIELIPILNTYAVCWRKLKEKGVKPEEVAQIFQPSGQLNMSAWKYPYVCPRNPVVVEEMEKIVQNIAREGKEIGLKTVALDDEYGLGLGWNGKGLCCFCKYCNAYFKKKTSLNPPVPKYVKKGTVIDENDPLYQWLKLIKGAGMLSPSIEYHNEVLKKAIKEVNPELKVVQMPGGVYGELDYVVAEFYQYMFTMPELDAVYEMERLKRTQDVKPKKEIWPLIGWYSAIPFPSWIGAHINLMGKLVVSKGARSIDFASIPLPWNYQRGKYKKFNIKSDDRFAGNSELKKSYLNLIKDVKKYEKLLLSLKPEKMPVAVLWSDTTVMYQQILKWNEVKELWEKEKKWKETPWEHGESMDIAYPTFLFAHIPVELITEKQVLEDKLDNYKALFLVNFQYTTKSVYKKIEDFIKNGGKVYADKSSKIKIKGVKELPVDFSVWPRIVELGLRPRTEGHPEKADFVHERQINIIRDFAQTLSEKVAKELPQPVKISNPCISYVLNTDGKYKYLFLFNSDLKNDQAADVDISSFKPKSIVNITLRNRRLRNKFRVYVKKGDWQIIKFSKEK